MCKRRHLYKVQPQKSSLASTDELLATAPTDGDASDREGSASDGLPTLMPNIFSLEELQNPDFWQAKDIHPESREKYLSDDVFIDTFGLGKEDFMRLPKWKQN